MHVRHLAGGAALAIALLMPATPALAQAYPGGTSTERSPGDVLGSGEARGSGADVKGVQVSRGETLPLTGTDTIQLTVLGAGLVAGGVVLVKRTRRQPASAPA